MKYRDLTKYKQILKDDFKNFPELANIPEFEIDELCDILENQKYFTLLSKTVDDKLNEIRRKYVHIK